MHLTEMSEEKFYESKIKDPVGVCRSEPEGMGGFFLEKSAEAIVATG